MSGSEVARVMEIIRLEYESANNGLYGLAEGKPRHAFISASYGRLGELQQILEKYMPPEQAWMKIVAIISE